MGVLNVRFFFFETDIFSLLFLQLITETDALTFISNN